VLVVGPDYPSSTLFQRLADAIMLFYDEDEADRMFAEAGFETFEHHIQQRRPGSPRAITTVATVPGGREGGEGAGSETESESGEPPESESEAAEPADDPVEV
jgi:demethylmenaquinone methyltransferase/2-methoxy-6-polyprenyl-1,4-benzoquinol methylase